MINLEEQATFVARTMTPWVPWAGKGNVTDVEAMSTYGAPGTEGLYYGTGQPDPSTSVIPTIDSNVVDAYKSWAGIGEGTEWPTAG